MIALVYENRDSEEHDNDNEGTNKTKFCVIYDAQSNISKTLVNYAKGEMPKLLALQMTKRTPNWTKTI